jgi:hypothetical protein
MIMSETILNREMLSEHLSAIIRTKKVKVRENDSSITLIPMKDPYEAIERACGMLTGDGHAVDRFMANKEKEKELDL